MPRPVQARHPRKGRVAYKKDGRPVTKVIRSKWYPFQVKRVKRGVNNRCRLRKGLTPGAVVILLTGPYRGRRVIFLKQLEQSGSVLVTGPFGVNGVPLRRVSQRFVIVTSVKVDISGVQGLDQVTDAYFKRPSKQEKLPEEKKKIQLQIDDSIAGAISKEKYMREYLKSYFTIVPGQPPHVVRF